MGRILFVINTLGTAGAEKAMLELLSGLKEEIDLYVIMNQGELVKELPDNVRLLNRVYDTCAIHGAEGATHIRRHAVNTLLRRGTCIRCLPYMLYHGIRMLIHRDLRMDKLLWQAMAMGADRIDTGYDLAVAYIEGGSTYYVDRYVRAKRKAAFIHVDYREAGYNRSLDRDCYKRMDRIFTVSGEVRDSFLQEYPELSDRTVIFHNMINIGRIEARSLEAGGYDDTHKGIRLLTIGRLNRQKALQISIETMRLLREKSPEVSFIWYVLGEGDERPYLEMLIRKYGLEDSFILRGNVENPYPYLRQCDIYVHESLYEGKSIAIQEAQILSKPILVSDCSGNREQVQDGVDGRICPLKPEAIRDTIIELLDMSAPDRAELGRAARRRIEAELNVNEGYRELKGLL